MYSASVNTKYDSYGLVALKYSVKVATKDNTFVYVSWHNTIQEAQEAVEDLIKKLHKI